MKLYFTSKFEVSFYSILYERFLKTDIDTLNTDSI
jgi:hypothetical protein